MSDPVGPAPMTARNRYKKNRLEAFSDGVFAIAITILVLEITVPVAAELDMLDAIASQWPSYLAYVISFATIGAAWLAHSVITEYLDRVDATFVRINLILLMVVAFIPFPTRLLAEHIAAREAEKIAAAFYGSFLMLSSLITFWLWRYATSHGLVQADLGDEDLDVVTDRLTPGIGGYVVLIGLGFLAPIAAVIGYLIIALFFLIPFPVPILERDRVRRRREQRGRSRQG